LIPLLATDPVYGALFWGAIVFWWLGDAWFGVRRQPPPEATVRDRGSRLVVVVFVGLGIAAAASLAFSMPEAAIGGPRRVVTLAGIALIIGGELFRVYAIRTLGRYFTFVVALHPGQYVVDTGPYRVIRHPAYTGTLVTVTGICLAMANWLALLGIVPAVLGFLYRIRVEEAALRAGLGEAYRAYERRTKRIIPYIV
jgi:protein-S-isoprenylcysteine O-methyltransferase Ste14